MSAAGLSARFEGPGGRPQAPDQWGLGAAMALGAHLLLVAALALSLNWKVNVPHVAEAELWAEVPRAAAPPAPVPAAPPPVEPARPVPPPPAPVAEVPPPRPEADIALAPTPERPRRAPPKEVFDTSPPKRAEPARERPPKAPPKTPPKESPKVQPKAPAAPTAKAADKPAPQLTAAEREAQRQANLMRMMSELGTLGTSGQEAQSAGPTSNYAGRIKARIKPNIVFTEWVQGNPLAVVELRCSPDGRIVASRLVTPSGVPSWDAAVLRAVERTEVLPANEQGRVPPVIVIEFRPRD